MSSTVLIQSLILLCIGSVALPLLILCALRLLGHKIRHGACYLILILCAIRILLPFGVGLPTVFDFSDLTPKTEEGGAIIIQSAPDGAASFDEEAARSDIFVSAEQNENVGGRVDVIAEAVGFFRANGALILLSVWGLGAIVCFLLSTVPQAILMRREDALTVEADENSARVYADVCVRLGIKRAPRLGRLNVAAIPHLRGAIRPTVVIGNADLDEQELIYVFSHELTHYRRGDILVKWLLLLDLSVFWWNPLVRLLVRRTQEEMEFSCDERVLASMEARQRHEYCAAILKLIKHHHSENGALAVGFSAERKGSVRRFREILSTVPKKKGSIAITVACLVLLLSGTILGISASELEQKPVTQVFYLKNECHLTEAQLIEISKTMEVPNVEGMRMTGWNVYSEKNQSGAYEIRFEAALEPELCGVSFVVNGGTLSEVKSNYVFGDALPMPERAGYTFGGWYRDVALRERVERAPVGSCVLYAKWAEESPTSDFVFTERNGTLTVSAYRGSATALVIPSYVGGMAVTGIDVNCFAFNTALTSVTLPETVTTVGAGAFRYCYRLETVTVKADVAHLDRSVFEACYALRKLTVNGSEREIPSMG